MKEGGTMGSDQTKQVEELVRNVRAYTWQTVRKLAMASTDGMNTDQVRERLEAIARLVRFQDDMDAIVEQYLDGADTPEAAQEALDRIKAALPPRS
jgi:hypothetical protein